MFPFPPLFFLWYVVSWTCLVKCSNAFTKFFYPVFEEMVGQHSSASKQFTIDGHVENFKRWLHLETRTGSEDFVITLQDKLKSLILTVSKQFSLEEAEVNCLHILKRLLVNFDLVSI